MKRLQQAGLNPNLVYAGNTATMPSATASPAQQPQTSPIDTQAVMHAVQLVVQGMIEKDKIQANKEIQSESIKAQKQISSDTNETHLVTSMLDRSSRESIEASKISSQESMFEKQLQLDRDRYNESIREFNLTFEQRSYLENARLKLDQYLSSLNGKKIISETALLDQQRKLHDELDELTLLISRNKITVDMLDHGHKEIEAYLNSPGAYIDASRLYSMYKKYGIDASLDQCIDMAEYFNRIRWRERYQADWGRNYITAPFKEVADIISPITSILTKVPK